MRTLIMMARTSLKYPENVAPNARKMQGQGSQGNGRTRKEMVGPRGRFSNFSGDERLAELAAIPSDTRLGQPLGNKGLMQRGPFIRSRNYDSFGLATRDRTSIEPRHVTPTPST